ncbi:MAG: pyridoxamine 5'-phosphate oxidase family protein [Firmicutes bacterium]|nr:pyridoxamine 5'-phosphate oxidase family protein [Bacillota bacterium]
MRRADREINDISEIISVMKECDVCRVALFDDEYPYILPLNFGMENDTQTGKIMLYFHGASEGKKYELISKNPRASFEMDTSHRLILDEEHGYCTMEYESVIGQGKITIIEGEEEKKRALDLLMLHYKRDGFAYSQASAKITKVMKLEVKSLTGKRRMKKS